MKSALSRSHRWASPILLIPIMAGVSAPALAQFPPGVFADGNHPAGPPDPQRLDQIWQVDPMSGALYLTIPFATVPTGGRGPKIPFALKYNSQSTVTLQSSGNLTYESASGTTPLATCNQLPGNGSGCILDMSAPMPSGTTQILQTYVWAPGSLFSTVGPLGPWTTTGPYVYNSTSEYIDQVIPGNGVSGPHNYGDGCATSGASTQGNVEGPFIYIDESGGAHDMNIVEVTCQYDAAWIAPITTLYNYYKPLSLGGSYGYGDQSSTVDGSAMLTTQAGVAYPDGTHYANGQLEDSNGNLASIGADSLGRTPFSTNLPVAQSGELAAGTYYVRTTNSTGGTEPYSVVISPESVGTYSMPHPTNSEVMISGYCLASVTCPTEFTTEDVGPPYNTFNGVTSVALPNGTAYTFCYDSSGNCGASTHFGLISKITFPTGGYVRFSYGIEALAPGYGAFTQVSSIVVTDAYLSDGSNPEAHWHYDYPTNGSVGSTITAPDGSYTQSAGTGFRFGLIGMFTDPTRPSYKETSHTTYNSNGTQIETVATFYSGPLPNQVVTTRWDGTSPSQRQTRYVYDIYYNVTEKDESDWQPCTSPCSPISSPAWLRKSYTSFNYWIDKTTVPITYVVNRPSQALVTDGSGVPYSFAQYGYDEVPIGGNTGYTGHDDAHYGLSSVLRRGNLTSEKHCLTLPMGTGYTLANITCSTWQPSTTHTYDLAGQVLSTTDPNGNKTQFSYADNPAGGCTPSSPTDGYVTTITYPSPLNYTESFSYYYCSGQVASHKDWNLQSTGYSYGDPGDMGRLTLTTSPDGGSTSISYSDATPPSITTTTATNEPDGPIIGFSQYDGLGRVTETELQSDPYGADCVISAYDANGRVYSVSNPSRTCTLPSSASQTTYFLYDGLNRLRTKTNPDGSTQSLSYAANVETFTDENLNQWTRTSNGISQLTNVLEPLGTASAATMATDYCYTPVGDLVMVKQWGGPDGSQPQTRCTLQSGPLTRSFAYNGASWLLGSNNPETASAHNPASLSCTGLSGSWTTCYGYDGAGNLTSKTDNRGYSVSYFYDAINRLVRKTYPMDSNGAFFSSCFLFGPSPDPTGLTYGRMIDEWTQQGSSCASSPPANPAPASPGYVTKRTISAYDPMGRLWNELQYTTQGAFGTAPCQTAHSGLQSYNYDYVGNVTCYGDGLQSTPGVSTSLVYFSQVFDAANHLQSITSSPTAAYPTNFYTLQSYGPLGPLQWKLGPNLSVNQGYTNRRWVNSISATGQIP